jgi:uncharacterized protein YkwD
MRTTRLNVLLSLILTLGLMVGSAGHAAAALGDLSGSLPAGGGLALTVWGGGSTATLQANIGDKGCTLQGVWYLDQQSQAFVTFVPGAPAVVNGAWNSRFASNIAANTALIVACRGAAPVAPPAPAAVAVGPAQSAQERDLSAQIVTGINAERAKRGLAALAVNGTLRESAEKYAPTQLAAGRLDHEIDGTEPWDRARALGYPSFNIGEVLAARTFTGQWSVATEAPKFVQMWIDSPPHRAIILSENISFTEIGVGCVIATRNGVEIYCAGETGRP